jgi:general nucleoside transport system permease protein
VDWVLLALLGVVLLALTERFARIPTADLTSSGTWSIALAWSIPILMAGLGGMFSERAGVVNIGLEGLLVLGTWFGAWGTLVTGNVWLGMLIGAFAGALGALLMADRDGDLRGGPHHRRHRNPGDGARHRSLSLRSHLPVLRRVDHPVTDARRFSARSTSHSWPGVICSAGRPRTSSAGWSAPTSSSWRNWAGFCAASSFQMSYLTLVGISIIPISWYLLWRTRWGLRLRSVGEDPDAADSLGVNVYLYKYYGVITSGVLSGFGGAFLAVQLSGLYREGQTNGKGFIGLATMIFGNWRPTGTASGSLLFGFAETLRLRDQNAPHALLLFVTFVLVLFAVRALFQRRWKTAVGTGLTAAVSRGLLSQHGQGAEPTPADHPVHRRAGRAVVRHPPPPNARRRRPDLDQELTTVQTTPRPPRTARLPGAGLSAVALDGPDG